MLGARNTIPKLDGNYMDYLSSWVFSFLFSCSYCYPPGHFHQLIVFTIDIELHLPQRGAHTQLRIAFLLRKAYVLL